MTVNYDKAAEYNQGQMGSGFFTHGHIVTLVEFWQEHNGLEVDGFCGPKTQKNIYGSSHPVDSLEIEGENRLGRMALQVATEELGNGEVGGNNSGEHVARYKGIPDDGDTDDDGAWCAAFISWCASEAASRLGVDLPFKTSQGAKRLYKNIGKSGAFTEDPQPGDVICWDRGKKGSWQGHIGIVERVEDGIAYTIEGNVGRYPSRVRRFKHDLTYEHRLEGFSRMAEV